MSLARYISKLAAMLGSDGKVPAAAIQDSAISFSKLLTTDWTNSLGATGYQKLPSGLIIQWGSYTATMTHGTLYTATFPIAYPNACLQVASSVGETVSTLVTPVTCPQTARTTTGFTFQYGTVNGASYSTTVHYIAVGY